MKYHWWMIFLLLFAQARAQAPVHIQVAGFWKGEPLRLAQHCDTSGWQIDVCKFYLGRLALMHHGQPVWSDAQVYHLIDLSDSSSLELTLSPPSGMDWDAVSFDIGVDSLHSVSGAFGGDLDPTKGMYWTWQSGYIDIKVEGTHPNSPAKQHSVIFHAGGYRSPWRTCRRVTLPVTASKELLLQLDVGRFLSQTDITRQYHLMSPGPVAAQLADRFQAAFSCTAHDE